jgi:hypothetical protein
MKLPPALASALCALLHLVGVCLAAQASPREQTRNGNAPATPAPLDWTHWSLIGGGISLALAKSFWSDWRYGKLRARVSALEAAAAPPPASLEALTARLRELEKLRHQTQIRLSEVGDTDETIHIHNNVRDMELHRQQVRLANLEREINGLRRQLGHAEPPGETRTWEPPDEIWANNLGMATCIVWSELIMLKGVRALHCLPSDLLFIVVLHKRSYRPIYPAFPVP